MQGTSTKGKVTNNAKLIARRSPEESEFLNDVIHFVIWSGSGGGGGEGLSAGEDSEGGAEEDVCTQLSSPELLQLALVKEGHHHSDAGTGHVGG